MNSEINNVLETASMLLAQARIEEAESFCRKNLRDYPDNPELLKIIGIAMLRKGNADRALSFFHRILALYPERADVLNLAGVAFAENGDFQSSENSYLKALEISPDYPEAVYNLANLKFAGNDFVSALELYSKAIQLKPDYAKAIINKGNVLKKLKRFDESLDTYDAAMKISPDSYELRLNRGTVFQCLDRFDEALAEYRKAASLNPLSPDPMKNIGDLFKDMLDLESAEASYRKAIDIKNDDADAHMFLGMTLLLQGKFPDGWAEYEWRLRKPEFARLSIPLKRMGNQCADGKILIVQAEQGFGDTVQFSRYLPILREHCSKLIFVCQSPLVPLIEKQQFADLTIPVGTDLKDLKADLHVPLMSIPFVLGTTLETIPARQAYIRPDPEKVISWGRRLAPYCKRKIGICWSGSPTNTNDHNRSMRFEEIERLFDLDCEFFVLQKLEKTPSTRYENLHDFSGYFKDFSDTAALIECMDIVITVDTVTAHLAGAMGKKTFLLLPFVPEWRWLIERHDSPWYPQNYRIYRQESRGDWIQVIDLLKSENF